VTNVYPWWVYAAAFVAMLAMVAGLALINFERLRRKK
jgi:hypothetical protein